MRISLSPIMHKICLIFLCNQITIQEIVFLKSRWFFFQNIILGCLVYKVASLKKSLHFEWLWLCVNFFATHLEKIAWELQHHLSCIFLFNSGRTETEVQNIKNFKKTISYRFSIFFSFLKYRWQNFVRNNTIRNVHKKEFYCSKTFA